MPRSLEDFIALNDPSPDAASTTLGQPVFKDRPTNKTGTSVLRELEALGLIEGLGANATLNSGSGASTANAKTARNTALKQLEIQRRQLREEGHRHD